MRERAGGVTWGDGLQLEQGPASDAVVAGLGHLAAQIPPGEPVDTGESGVGVTQIVVQVGAWPWRGKDGGGTLVLHASAT